MIKIAIIGPESTGKSTLAQALAAALNCPWVPEYAREYLENLKRPYQESDLLSIAKGQIEAEDRLAQSTPPPFFLVCDTELSVIKIWSDVKYGRVHPDILRELHSRRYDHYFLTYIDLPWEEDPLREHPDKRDYLFELYLKECETRNLPFTILKGSHDRRVEKALEIIRDLEKKAALT
jgi:NadR type nicotinamide-nucleotide adenylyltransferase